MKYPLTIIAFALGILPAWSEEDGHDHDHDHGGASIELETGHADVEVAFEDGELELHIHDEITDMELEPGNVVLHVPEEAETSVPDNANFAFLGNAGNPLWVLPQNAQADVLFLGVAAGEVESGVLMNDTAYVELVSVDGPGQFYVYDTDAFGVPNVMIDSADGITSDDRLTVLAGAHFHVDWTFDAEGDYDVTFVIKAALTDGTPIESDPVTLAFEVGHHEEEDDGHGHGEGIIELETGHADVEVAYEDGELELHIHDETTGEELEPGNVIMRVPEIAETSVPDNANFAFLGNAGDPLWILPQVAQSDVLFLGGAAGEVETGVFMNDITYVELMSVDGPGQFYVYDTDAFGAPNVMINSADGISSDDRLTVLAGSHGHVDWTFDAEGDYDVTFVIKGTLTNGTTVESDPVTLAFEVGPHEEELFELETGHADVGLAYEDGELELHIHDEETDIEYEPSAVLIVLNEDAELAIPDTQAFSFLGDPDYSIWVLPQSFDEHLPFLGLAAEEVPAGIFVDDLVALELVSVDASGNFFAYRTDGLGDIAVMMDSADGIESAQDRIAAAVGSHQHLNWAFNASGTYRIGFRVSGTLQTGGELAGETMFVTFTVPEAQRTQPIPDPDGDIVRLKEGEVDLGVAFEEGAFDLHLHDEASDIEYEASEARVSASAVARSVVPDSANFSFLGTPNQTVWILPQTENTALPFLGVAGEEIEEGVFQENKVNLAFVALSGPGEMSMYAVDGFGAPNVHFNSQDGLTEADFYQVGVGSHAHVNWAFTAPGVYEVTLQASGMLVDGGAIQSEATTFVFEIEPSLADDPFDQWTLDNFGINPGDDAGIDGNPDLDDLSNVLEFAFGTDPNTSDSTELVVTDAETLTTGTPALSTLTVGDDVSFTVRFIRRVDAESAGLAYNIQFSRDMAAWEATDQTPTVVATQGEYEVVEVDFPFALSNGRKPQFFRVLAELAN